jgi:hypothetical protein
MVLLPLDLGPDEDSLKQAVRALVDERLIEAYWDGVKHMGTRDLVLYIDTEAKVRPLRAFVREKLLADIPRDTASSVLQQIRLKLDKPADQAEVGLLKTASTAFWLIVGFPGDRVWCSAVRAEVMSAAGTA